MVVQLRKRYSSRDIMSTLILVILLSATVVHSKFSEKIFFDKFQQILSERIEINEQVNNHQKSIFLRQNYDNQRCNLHLQRLLGGILNFDLWAVERKFF